MYRGLKVAAVIPALNEEKLVCRVLDGLPPWVDTAIVVDDGSSDGTGDRVRAWKSSGDLQVILLRHETTLGVGAGLKTGYARALAEGADLVAILAGDDQMDASRLPELLDPLVDGRAGYTKGNRLYSAVSTHGMSAWRRLGNRILTLLTRASSGAWHVSDPQNGYTAVTRQALDAIGVDNIYPWYGYCNDMLARFNAADVVVLDVPIPARYGEEKSKIRYGRYIQRVSGLLVRNLIWRLRHKYAARNAWAVPVLLAIAGTTGLAAGGALLVASFAPIAGASALGPLMAGLAMLALALAAAICGFLLDARANRSWGTP